MSDPSSIEMLYASLRRILGARDAGDALAAVAGEAAAALRAKDCVVTYRRGDDLVSMSANAGVRSVASPLGRGAFIDEPGSRLPSVRAILGDERVIIEDVRRFDGPPGFQEACAAVGIAAVLVEPVHSSSMPAALNVGFGEPTELTPRQLSLAVVYAEQAGLALDRAIAQTRERETLRRLQELDEVHHDFLATVSHELRTPLTAIQGFGETLDEHWDEMDEPRRRHLAKRILEQAAQLETLINELLDYTKLESGALALNLEPLDLGIQIPRAADRVAPLLHGHVVEIDAPTGLVALSEPGACARVIGNLLSNAAKFSPPGSRIRIVATRIDGEVLVRVEDEGVGIPESERERVFNRFYRVDRSDSAPRGTGLGLAIVRQYIRAMGGRTWAESSEGGGAAVCFTLPAAG